jgi:hypothetical protein
MKYTYVVFAIVALGMAGCGRDVANVNEGGKLEGPPVGTLAHDQLMAAYHECTEYGPINDPKVKYTVRYCAAIQIARLSEGYTASGTAKVDPTLNKMH